MNILHTRWFALMCLLTISGFALISARSGPFRALTAQTTTASAAPSETQKSNLQAYATLLQEDVPDEKEQLIALVMFFNEADAAKFWPIYAQYKAELDKLNTIEAASIYDYVKNNSHLSEQQADQVVHSHTQFQSQRAALLDKYYGQFKAALGPVTAARFFEAENQLLSLTDLQLSSKLPVE